jgi:hypothetical protein
MNIMMKALRNMGATTVVFTSAVLAVSHLALADTQAVTLTDPLGGKETFTSVATAVAGFLFWDIAAPLATIMVLVGAFQLITSSGDPEKVSQGKKTITYAAIGLVVALIAGGIVSIIQSFVSGS